MRNFIGTGELGKEEGIGNNITGDGQNTNTTEWRPRIEKESTEDTKEEVLLNVEKEVMVNSTGDLKIMDMRIMKDVRGLFLTKYCE